MHARPPSRLLLALPLLALPLLAACGDTSGDDCPTGQVMRDGVCETAGDCTPGALRCDGLRGSEVCSDAGDGWVAADACGLEEICREGHCLATFVCEDEEPACCATMAQCGEILQPSACAECMEISRDGWCDAGSCRGQEGDSTSLWLVADGRHIPGASAERVQSAVATLYHAYTADGSALDCERLLDGGAESLHDTQHPFLNPVYSQPMGVQNLGGTDQFEMRPGAVPVGTDVLIVVSLFDGTGGGGTRLARGCIEGADTTAGTNFAIPMTAW